MSHHTTPDAEPSTILHDQTPRGREKPWVQHKLESQVTAAALALAGDQAAADRMATCADWLEFRRLETGALTLNRANFCRIRLCPMCQWRRSLRVAAQVQACDTWAQQERARQGKRPWAHYLLTLTVRNVPGPDLTATLDDLTSAWDRFSRRAAVKRAMRGGYVRATEITYNSIAGTYHPHMHILVLCNRSYFVSRDYLNHDKWQALWRDAARLDYDPQVDVRRCTSDLSGAVAEVCKYTTKPGSYLLTDNMDETATVVGTLASACNRRRFLALGGEYRRAAQALNLGDPEDGDLVHISADAGESDAGARLWPYTWYPGPHLYMRGGPK